MVVITSRKFHRNMSSIIAKRKKYRWHGHDVHLDKGTDTGRQGDGEVSKSKVNAAICIAHRREHASNALPLPVSRRWSPLASHQPGIQRTLWDHGHRAGMSCDMPVYFHSFRQVLIIACTEGRLRLSRPGCLVPRRGGLPVQRRSPT